MKFKKLLQIKKNAFSAILSLLTLCSFTQLIAQPPPPTMDLKIEFDETTDIYGAYFRTDLEINSASMIISQVYLALPQMLNLLLSPPPDISGSYHEPNIPSITLHCWLC